MKQWRKGIASWCMGKNLYLSVPFTWLLPLARHMAQHHDGPVFAGGPAVDLMPDKMADVATLDEPPPVPPIIMHNPLATFTTRGCPNHCPFCAVPRTEGDLRELKDWPVRPVVCDNNLLAASRKHFDRVIDRLKGLPYVDFNQGLDARLFKPHHARRIAELRGIRLRFAFDSLSGETAAADALALGRKHGLREFGMYCLIGYREAPEEAHYRLAKVREWGFWPTPMRYQPLDALKKDCHVAPGWTESELRRTMRYYSRLQWFGGIPFGDFSPVEPMPLFGDGTRT